MILFLLIVIEIVRGKEILFNCTFNEGFNNDCAFHSRIPSMIETLQIVDHHQTMTNMTNPPDRPISDATSVFSSTIDGEKCIFPYEFNGWQMYFCWYENETSDFQCPTIAGNQTCSSGQYAYLNASNPLGLLAIFRFNQTIVHNTTDVEHCLRFYSYFTDYERNSSMTLRMSSNTIPGQDIVTVTPQKENRWYYYEISFRPIGEEYHLGLVFNQRRDQNDTTDFIFALDDILISSGSCIVNDTELLTKGTFRTKEVLTTNEIIDTTDVNNAASASDATTAIGINAIRTSEPHLIMNSSISVLHTSVSMLNEITIDDRNTSENDNLTMTTSIHTTTSTSNDRLPLIFGLSVGLGVPVVLLIIVIVFHILTKKRCFTKYQRTHRVNPSNHWK